MSRTQRAVSVTVGMIPVSVVVMTRNEAECLPACLDGVRRFAQVFVVDSASEDGTAAIARRMGAEVVPFHWNGKLPKKKQWCLENLPFAYDWVFFVDADEVVTPALAAEIAAKLTVSGEGIEGWFVPGRPVFLGRELRFGWQNSKLALFNRHHAHYPAVDDLDVTLMWEVEGHFQPRVSGRVGYLKAPLLHDDRKPLSAWMMRHIRYAAWEAALADDGRLATLDAGDVFWRGIAKKIYRRLPLRPLALFLMVYILKLGFLDGTPGFHYAVARAVYCWQITMLNRDAKQRCDKTR